MCNYHEFCDNKEDYGIHILRGVFAPSTLICQDCSLIEQSPPKKKPYGDTVRDDLNREYSEKQNCFTCHGEDYPVMLQHVKKHIEMGEKIHPSVMIILKEAYHNHCMSFEYSVACKMIDRDRDEVLKETKYSEQPWSPKFRCKGCQHISNGYDDYTSNWKKGERKPNAWCVKCSNCNSYQEAAKWERLEGWKEL